MVPSTVLTACQTCGATASTDARFCASCGAPFTAADVDPLGGLLRDATLGDYDVHHLLGRGGMAAVYLAWDLRLDRYVAIKVMFQELAHRDTMPQRFLQEARTAARLDDHPNIVRIYRAEERRGLRFFVMKYIDGCSLEQLLGAVGALPLPIASLILHQVAGALHYAHERGVIHRDVKPGNVMLDKNGLAIVTDFGIAKVAQGEPLTSTGLAIGTPAYMSPEQWGAGAASSASDQYALGIIGHRMLTGRVPFDGTVVEVLEQHLHEAPAPIRATRPDCPPALEAAVTRMLAKAPTARWPTLADALPALDPHAYGGDHALRAELGALVASVAGSDDTASWTPHSPIPVRHEPATPPPAPVAPVAPVPPRRRRWLSVAAGVGALAIVAASAVALWRRDDPDAREIAGLLASLDTARAAPGPPPAAPARRAPTNPPTNTTAAARREAAIAAPPATSDASTPAVSDDTAAAAPNDAAVARLGAILERVGANRSRVESTSATTPLPSSDARALPPDVARIATIASTLPVRATEQRHNVAARFLGCWPLPAHAEMVCLVRLANVAPAGQTRVFLDRLALEDANGRAGKLTGLVWLATGEPDHVPIARNIAVGTEQTLAIEFLDVAMTAVGGTFRLRVSPGWTADRYTLAFPSAMPEGPLR